jgi:hypothetical protein
VFILFAACGRLEAAASDDALVAQAVQNGIIISPDALEGGRIAFSTEEAEEGSIVRSMDSQVNLHFPVTVDLSFERGGGRLDYRNANTMQFVSEGDVLMRVVFDEAALRMEEQQLLLRMGEADRRHNSERARRRADIETFRNEVPSHMNEFDIEIHNLRLEGMEDDYNHMIHGHQVQVRENNRQLEEIRIRLAGEELIAPFDGVVFWANPMRVGSVVESWMIMITLYDYNSFQLLTRGTAELFRYGDIITVTDVNEIERLARVVSDPLANIAIRENNYEFILEPLDDIDASHFFPGVVSASALLINTDGVLVPSRAINNEDQRRFVFIYEDGIIRRRFVQTGAFHMDRTQIIDGVEAGQLVVLN